MRISNAGLRESHVHDVIITREAPNYHVDRTPGFFAYKTRPGPFEKKNALERDQN